MLGVKINNLIVPHRYGPLLFKLIYLMVSIYLKYDCLFLKQDMTSNYLCWFRAWLGKPH